MSRALIVPDNQREAPLDLGGFEITVLASEDDTGDYEVFYIAGPEGKGPGPHYHPWHESFFILQGTLHCGVDDTETIAQPGTLMHVPAGSTHWFHFGKGGGAMLSMTSKGNASRMFTDFARGVSWNNPDRNQLIALADKHGQIVLTADE